MSAAYVPGNAFGRRQPRRFSYEGTPLHRRDELTVRGQGLLKQFDRQRIFATFLPLGSRRTRSARMPRPSWGDADARCSKVLMTLSCVMVGGSRDQAFRARIVHADITREIGIVDELTRPPHG
jgi:hypothetical protein